MFCKVDLNPRDVLQVPGYFLVVLIVTFVWQVSSFISVLSFSVIFFLIGCF